MLYKVFHSQCCQAKVIVPNLKGGERRETLFSANSWIVKQQVSETALLRYSWIVTQHSWGQHGRDSQGEAALVKRTWCSSSGAEAATSARETVFRGDCKCTLVRPNGSWLIQKIVLAPHPWLACSHADEDCKSLPLIDHPFIGWNGATLMQMIWLHSSDWMGKVRVLLAGFPP